MTRFQTFEDYDVVGDVPRLSAEQILLAPYKTIQEAAQEHLKPKNWSGC